ncbi:MAG: branched-chain amino acid ABC transporter permease [Anaerolineae bacterium]|nr:branched-chain amino acid ABC transporter permease [Anaerolineae bacterium]
MSELAATRPIPIFQLDADRLTSRLLRVTVWLIVLDIFWSITLTSGLLTGLAQRYLGTNGAEFFTGFWLVLHAVNRVLVVANLIALVAGLLRHRGDTTGYGGRALVGIFGLIIIWLISERVYVVTQEQHYILTLWGLQLANGLITGSLYALIALGYTLVYGILLMINFAHGDVMMIGSFFGFFALQIFRGDPNVFVPRGTPPEAASLIGTVLVMIVVVGVAMLGSMATGLTVERIAYRPLRRAPRLVPLISAIGASFFLQQMALRIFGPSSRTFDKPTLLAGTFPLNLGAEFGAPIPVSRIGIIVFFAAILLMIALFVLVRRTKIGRAMRAVAEDKDIASLMGANVNRTIAVTFAIGAALAGAAGVMWGLYNGQTDPFSGFLPGIKAFTAAVLGGIGNIPGAMLGGLFLGLVEALGPFALGIAVDYQNVIAFTMLILVLIFRPKGLLGEVLAEKKV